MLMPNNSKGGASRGSTFKDVVKTPGNKRDKQQPGGGNKNPLLPTQQNQKRAPAGQPPNPGDGNKLVSQLSVQPAPSRMRSKRRARDDKPTALMRAWVRVDPQGNSSILHADKLTLTQQLGIQPRDLRLLESQVANQTSVILCRERAIVINMSFVKTIITLDACYIVSPDDERAIQFMAELKNRLQEPLACSKSVAKLTGGQEPEWARQALELPFELRCLEICLDELASDLDERAKQLEATAYPAVDAMAKVSNRPNLDRVRRVKNALIQLYKTTETFHEALEELLDNDKDMWELNLGAKEAARQMAVEEGTGMHGQGRDVSDAQHTQLAPVAEDEVLAMAPLPEEPHYKNFTNGETQEEDDHGGHATGAAGEPMDPPPPWLGSPEEHRHDQGEVPQGEFMGGAFGSFHPDPHLESQNATTASIVDDSERNAMSDGLAAVSTASAPAALPRDAAGWNTNSLARQAVVAAAERAAGSSAAGFSEHTDGGSRTRDGSDSGDTELPFPPSATSTPRARVDTPALSAPVASNDLFLSGAASAPASTSAHPQSPPPPGARYRTPVVRQLSPFASASCVGLFDTHPMSQVIAQPVSATPTGTPVLGGTSAEGSYPGWHQQPQGVSRASLDGMTFSPNRLSLGAASPYDRPLNTMSQHASLVRLSRHSLALLSARHGSSLASSSAMSSVYDMEVAEVERLLEAYFMHINTVHTRLKTLGEYIEDTEEMVYSSLNAKRNRLLAYDLCFIGINTISMTVTAVTGLFTMNLFHPEEDEYMYTSDTFLELAFAGLGAYLLFGGLLAYYMHTGVVRFT